MADPEDAAVAYGLLLNTELKGKRISIDPLSTGLMAIRLVSPRGKQVGAQRDIDHVYNKVYTEPSSIEFAAGEFSRRSRAVLAIRLIEAKNGAFRQFASTLHLHKKVCRVDLGLIRGAILL